MNNPMLLQKQLRDNSKDLQDFCKDLKCWGDEMKRKEHTLYPNSKIKEDGASKIKKPDETKPKEIKKQIGETAANKKGGATSYSAWEKFDADAECNKLDHDSSSESELTDEFDETKRDQAIVYKEQGNNFVKKQEWDKAIECYTKAINLYGYDPVFYANRAWCYIKKNEMAKAEEDCNNSLKLDDTYVKAYQRRALIRENLKRFEDAEKDLKKVLSLEPNNKDSKIALEKLGAKMKSQSDVRQNKVEEVQRPLSKFTAARNKQRNVTVAPPESLPKIAATTPKEPSINLKIDSQKPEVWISNEDIIPVKAANKPPHLRSKKPLKRIEIEEIDIIKTKEVEPIFLNPVTTSWPQNDTNISSIKSDDLLVVERKRPNEKEIKNKANIEKSSNAALVNSANCKHDLHLEAPKTSVQFYSTWKYLPKWLKYEYLKLIKPNEIPELFKESLESDIFSEILVILSEYYISNHEQVYNYLVSLTEVKRFSTLILFLNMKDKNCLWKLFTYIKEYENKTKENIDALVNKYEL